MRANLTYSAIILLVALSSFQYRLLAKEINVNTARNVAMNLYAERSGQGSKPVTITKIIEEKENGLTTFYILVFDKKGFAIISAEDAVRPILGYSFESGYNENDHSPAFEYFIMKRLKKQIYAVIQAKQTPEPKTVVEWAKYSAQPENFKTDGIKSSFPLLRTLWDQDSLYNAMCPADPDGPDGHAYVGCVATAMAQVLNYWQHPWHGTGSHSYTPESHPEYGSQFADFGAAVYNFDNMPDTVTTYSDDLAELMYHCAVSVDMNFGPNGSGASGWGNNDISYALETWFYFNDAANDLNRSSYAGSLWTDLLNAELDLNRPIIYGANDNDFDAGHSWVLDAYTSGDMYHCNWGWSGSDNGWYLMDNFEVNGYVFDDYQTACVHIYPQVSHVNGTWNIAGSPYYLNYDYYVDPGDELIIEPGVEVIYNGRYKLEVRGRLDAQGTAADSIYFKSGWTDVGIRGVSFSNTNDYTADSSRLAFCKFEDGAGHIMDLILPDHTYGGSVLCSNSSKVSITNCIIANSTAYWGGALACLDTSGIRVSECWIVNDSASSEGGGVYLSESDVIFNHNLIENNKCAWSNGGGITCEYSEAAFYQDTIRNNQAQFGGGMGLHYADIDLENVVIYNNSANVDGGGIYMMESSPEMNGVHFFNNTADGIGGAMLCYSNSSPQVSRTLINANYAPEGAAIAVYSANPVLSHVTITNNNIYPDGEAVSVNNGSFNFSNSILWDNFHDDIDTSGTCNLVLVYSIIQHAPWTGTGVLRADPLFSDPFLSNYHLRWDGYPLPDENKSSAIDAGDPAAPFDPDGTRTDLGVFPFSQTYTPLAGGNINGSLTCDGSPYFVTGNLTIPVTDQLIIEPCVSLIFRGDYRLEVRGRLEAEGTESSRINFACSDTVTGWQGIRFINTATNGLDSSRLVHCRITFGNADGISEYEKGGALYFTGSGNVVVDHCLINKNKAKSLGGAISIASTYGPKFAHNTFENNYSPLGGAIFGIYTTINLTDNLFRNNKATDGGAIYVHTSNILSAGNSIHHNRAEQFGGGIYIVEHGTCIFDPVNKSNIYLNYAAAAGLDLFFTGNASYVKQIVVDTFTVQTVNEHFAFPMQNFNITKSNSVISQVSSNLYIDMEGSDENSGTSAGSPLKTMYMACMKIMADASNPHTIYLAEGTYSQGATGEVFPVNWRDFVSLKGAGIEETIIYGEEKNQLLYCYHDDGFAIDSITFQGGYGVYGGAIRLENHSSPYITKVEIKDNAATRHGGGIYCKDYSSPHINEIKVYDNTVNEHGGGIMLYNYCDAIIENSMIYDNFALYNGGGICTQFYSDVYFDSLTVYNNTAVQGGGLNFNWACGGSVNNSIIQGNNALTHVAGYSGTGGGVWIYYYSSPAFNNVQIKLNHADAIGGGVYASSQTYTVYKNCLFDGNTAGSGGGAYLNSANHHFYNTVFCYNQTGTGHGGAIASYGGSPVFTNVTITENSANGSGHGGALYNWNSSLQFINSILWDNSPEEITIGSGTITATYCDIEGGFTGTGNINEDPLFDWTYNGQYDLGAGSPCINGGIPDTTGLLLPLADLGGNPRISNGIIDMGAYEFQFTTMQIILDIKAWLEGPFNGTGMSTNLTGITDFPLSQPYGVSPWNYSGTESVSELPAGVVDWVLIELRDATDAASATPSTRIARQAAFVMSDGNIRSLDGTSPQQFDNLTIQHSLFAVVYHRNHLAIMSANPLTESGGFYSYDFTTGATQAFNNSQKEITSGVWGMFAGDANADGAVNQSDITENWVNDAGNSGYLNNDFNLDTQVDNKDKNDFAVQNTGTGSQLPFECDYSLFDLRDGQAYNTVQIGSQCWMAENLNIGIMLDNSVGQTDNATIEKYCYNGISVNCDLYGGLYQWNEMMQYFTVEGNQGICPEGWHVPTDDEWCTLENEADAGTIECSTVGLRGTDAGGNLKEAGTSHWYSPNTGATDSRSFTSLPGGGCNASGNSFSAGADANFWSSTGSGSNGWIRQLAHDHAQIDRYATSKEYGLSIRCVKN